MSAPKTPKTTKHEPLPTTTDIPRGKAHWYTHAELPVRREREINVLSGQLNMTKLKALSSASEVIVDGQPVAASDVLIGESAVLSASESRLLFDLTDTAIWAYLKGWTLRTDAGPRPLPQTVEDVLDLPRPLYEALAKHAAKILAQSKDDVFSVDAVEDPASPTEAFGD